MERVLVNFLWIWLQALGVNIILHQMYKNKL